EREREPARESPPAEVEHPCALHLAVPHQGDVCGPATDVDEDATVGPDLLAGTGTGKGVWLRHRRSELEVKLTHHCLDGVDVSHRSELVENRDLEVLAGETDRVGHRVAVDAHVGDRRMNQPRLELPVASFQLEQVLRLAQSASLHHL